MDIRILPAVGSEDVGCEATGVVEGLRGEGGMRGYSCDERWLSDAYDVDTTGGT